MNETYKKLIFILLSIGVLAGAWFGVVSPRNEKTNSVRSEVRSLTDRYNELLSKEVNRQQYIDDTQMYRDLYVEKLDEFPSNWDQEYQIEFIQGVRNNENIDYDVSSLGMSQPSMFYSLGGSNSEGVLAADGSETGSSVTYTCYSSMESLQYTGSYEGVKAFMDYVASFPYRMTLDSVNLAYSEGDDQYTGSMAMNIYYITGGGREEQFDIDLNDVDTGVDNLFIGGEGASNISKFASDNGEAIKSDYDLYLTLVPADSDASAKTVGVKGVGSAVTSSKNESETVSIKLTQDGTTYIAEYGIGTEKMLQEFDPGDDLTLLIQSSDLKDSSDSNKASISIDNTTDKTLYVKVADDGSANRAKIANRAGSIIVYR